MRKPYDFLIVTSALLFRPELAIFFMGSMREHIVCNEAYIKSNKETFQ